MQRTFCKQCLNSLSRMRRCPRVPATPSAVCAGPLQRIFSRVAPGTRAPGLNSDHGRCFSWMLHSVHVFLCAFIAKSYLPISEVSESTRSLHRTSLRVPCMQQAFSRMNATQKIETSALLKEWLTTMKHQCYAALSPKTASESSAEAATTRCNMQ